jgi:hypothetical protein
MRKVKLDLEQLAVDSFVTSAVYGRGTVLGRMSEYEGLRPAFTNAAAQQPVAATYPECPSPLCVDTPLASCDGSCMAGCGTATQLGDA